MIGKSCTHFTVKDELLKKSAMFSKYASSYFAELEPYVVGKQQCPTCKM